MKKSKRVVFETQMNRYLHYFFPILFFLLGSSGTRVFSQDVSSMAPALMGGGEGNSLVDMLKTDILKRLTEAESKKDSTSTSRRPKPELGQRGGSYEPIDISKYLGPDGSADKTIERLQDLGIIPGAASFPLPTSASREIDIWKDVPIERRIHFLNDSIQRRNFTTALEEADEILQQDLTKDQLLQTLICREKALFHRRHYDTVQHDFYRMKAYFNKKPEIDQLKRYLEDQSGLAAIQKEVLNQPSDPKMQNELLRQYKKYGWLDFAEEFFIQTIQDTSVPTVKTLSDIYFTKKDYEMLIKLSQAGQRLYPEKADFYYNEGIGHYNLKDRFSLITAKEKFTEAKTKHADAQLRSNIDWYLSQLKSIE
jgi:hypothetical protein